ncbi:hypothetical protein GCM10011297_14920 [Bacterioplanes sanyensis]|nr:hypothetical protein GCM10011297_14920 [Bacterioplanes sanyensis]
MGPGGNRSVFRKHRLQETTEPPILSSGCGLALRFSRPPELAMAVSAGASWTAALANILPTVDIALKPFSNKAIGAASNMTSITIYYRA